MIERTGVSPVRRGSIDHGENQKVSCAILCTADPREGIIAFLDKRLAKWISK